MKTRLLLARRTLLNPDNSILIVTIDEKEYLHLGCLLEELFQEATIQMITSVISAKGVVRTGQFSKLKKSMCFTSVLEKHQVVQTRINMLDNEVKKKRNRPIMKLGLRRREPSSKRARPNQFIRFLSMENTGKIKMVGDALSDELTGITLVFRMDVLLFGR